MYPHFFSSSAAATTKVPYMGTKGYPQKPQSRFGDIWAKAPESLRRYLGKSPRVASAIFGQKPQSRFGDIWAKAPESLRRYLGKSPRVASAIFGRWLHSNSATIKLQCSRLHG
uniref:Uncharacterized protein n=1 Tax=Meloidogyne incognita TaxID=6306 RepID=A0A914KJL4_MELIC